jgi:hypothetical protein
VFAITDGIPNMLLPPLTTHRHDLRGHITLSDSYKFIAARNTATGAKIET